FLLLSGLTVVNVAVIASRRRFPEIDRPFTVPAVPWVPAIAILANIGLLFNVEPTSFAVGVVAEVIGIGLWFGYIDRAPSLERIERETPTAVAEYTSPGLDYQVVVPIANPANVEQLMRTATTLAEDHGGEVLVTSVVTVPDQTPLSEGRQLATQRRAVLDDALSFADDRGVPVSGAVRIAHNAGDGILNTLTQHEADAVILGWRGHPPSRSDVVFGSTVDRVVRDADCDVYVEKIGPAARGRV
ncbi:MAG: universal stress protein, partial [Actinobacteria bacterium]|nr:universal stress protein [Actinomycetota bacterium]NIU67764.1 universal stress protein [Actinomycetota bacterium]NIW29532.1 universal stress protein [Actinomycetota bacterium]NIX22022.1 universal stress protein [Actinomycetota bacterium]